MHAANLVSAAACSFPDTRGLPVHEQGEPVVPYDFPRIVVPHFAVHLFKLRVRAMHPPGCWKVLKPMSEALAGMGTLAHQRIHMKPRSGTYVIALTFKAYEKSCNARSLKLTVP